jgi:hypothetical protein
MRIGRRVAQGRNDALIDWSGRTLATKTVVSTVSRWDDETA